MKAKITKSYLKGYRPGLKIVGGVAVATTIIVGGYFTYKSFWPKAQTNSSNTKSTTTNNSTLNNNYDGRYVGTYTVANGISAADVVVNGGNLSGNASYTAPDGSKIPLKVTGTVQRGDTTTRKDGNIVCSFSGTGTILRQKATVSGACSGHIIGSSMNVSYSATAVGAGQSQTYPGQITLSKQ